MRKTTTIRERIATRAYFAWLNGSTATADANWLEAEAIETALAECAAQAVIVAAEQTERVRAERRSAAAKKAAVTRRAKAAPKMPAGVLVATKGRLASRRITAH